MSKKNGSLSQEISGGEAKVGDCDRCLERLMEYDKWIGGLFFSCVAFCDYPTGRGFYNSKMVNVENLGCRGNDLR